MARISVAASFALTSLFILLSSAIPQSSSAVDCNNPPRGFGGSWARTYKNWCESCGGRYNSSNQSCTPGPNWGGGSSYGSPSYDYEAERRRQEEERRRREEEERRRQQELEAERKREEDAARIRQEKFEREKQEALKGMKGIEEGGLGLKEIGNAPAGRPEGKIRADIDAAGRRIPELRKEIQGLQALLRQFGASQRGNVSELEKWDETFQAAAESSRKNAVDYGMSMFLQYNLLGSLERSVRQDTFKKLDELINSSDPAMRRWLGEQLKQRNVDLERVKTAVTVGTLGGDFASLFPDDRKSLKGDLSDTGKALDALLFVNDLLEATKVVRWSGSQYFQQAKMIGETYTDLAAFGFSAANVRKANKVVDAYNREIRHLSWMLENAVKEMNCLEKCLDAYTDRCLDRCTGKTRFGSPPPSPRVVDGRNGSANGIRPIDPDRNY